MKQYKFIQKLLLAVLALGCASCSQDEETQVNQQNLVVLNVADTGLVSSESQTRTDRKSTRLNSSHKHRSRMPSSA